MEVVASLSQGRTAAAQCGLFTYKSVLVIFEPPCSNQPFLINHYVSRPINPESSVVQQPTSALECIICFTD